MCKVIVKEPEKNIQFIIYNHLYSRNGTSFTVDELKKELNQQYHLEIEEPVLNIEIGDMIRNGIVTRGVNCYKRAAVV